MDMKLEEALLLGSAYYRVLEGTIEELGDYGEEGCWMSNGEEGIYLK